MIIIHGENTIDSKNKLFNIISEAKNKGHKITRVDAKELDEANLEEILGANDLFATSQTIVIEGLHSLPKSKKQMALIEMCNQTKIHEIVLWEKRSLTKTMLKKLSTPEIFEFKISKTLFTWLDMLGKKEEESKKLNLLHKALESDGDYFCFIMLVRQFRLLIQAKSGGKIAGAPFMITKLKRQAQNFSLEQLLDIYQKLLKMDYLQKTSKNLLSTNQWLDLLTIKI